MLNQAIIIGRITKDLELRKTQTGTNVCKFTIACQRNLKNSNGEYESDFINCTSFGKTAEYMEKYLTKGQLISVAGRIQTGSYEKDGHKVYTTDILVNEVNSLEKTEKSNSEPKKDDYIDPSKLANTLDILESDLPF